MFGTILIILCAALWATDSLFRLPLSRSIAPATIVFYEHAICLLATFPWFLLRRKELRALKLRGWSAIIFVGIMGSAVGTYFFTSAYNYLNPSVVILLQKLQPVFAVMGARFFLGEMPRKDFYIWGIVAIVGSGMISIPDYASLPEITLFNQRTQGVLLSLGAALCWGLSTVFGKFVTGKVSFPVTAFLRFAFGFAGIAVLFKPSPAVTQAAFPSLITMALIPGTLAIYLYYAGLKRTKASIATFAELFFPLTAVIINWKFLGQTLTSSQIVGMGLLLTAVFYISKGLK